MKLQIKPEKWLCAVTAFAMALGRPVREVLRLFDHDGDAVIFDDLPDPQCRRGHNPYDFVEVALSLGYALTPIALRPVIVLDDEHQCEMADEETNYRRFEKHVRTSAGIIEMANASYGHMMAYDRGTLFDPDGESFPYSIEECKTRNIGPFRLWRLDRLEESA